MPFQSTTFLIQKEQKAFLWLMREFGYSQKEAQKILDKGWVTQNHQAIKKAQSIIGEVKFLRFVPQRLFLKKLFLHPYFVIYDKPANLLTHPKSTQGDLSVCDELKAEFGASANPAHRLDALTSGILLCSINKSKEASLKAMFERGEIKKSYQALVRGRIQQKMLIDAPILSPKKDEKYFDLQIRSKISSQGKKAQTYIKPIWCKDEMSLVEAIPLTGRTHQIRLHLCHIGHSILGDPLYGCEDEKSREFLDFSLNTQKRKEYFGMERLALHASRLEFEFEGERVVVESKPSF